MPARQLSHLFIAALLALCLQPINPAIATDYTVDSTSACTLPDAIRAANRDQAVGDCEAGSADDAIMLTSNITINATLPDIRSNIAIEGIDALRTVSGGGSHRILNMSRGRLTLENLQFSRGQNGQTRGGALRMTGGHAQLTGVVFSNNYARNGGGAVRISGSSLTCTSCYFISNQSSHGGAIWVSEGGNLTLSDTTFLNNHADYGGAIINKHGVVTLQSTTVGDGNTAIQGGGIFSHGGTLTITAGSVISDNEADTYGGGILVYSGTLKIGDDNSNRIINNSGAYGGGVYTLEATVRITGAAFSGNSAKIGADLLSDRSDTVVAHTVSITDDGQYFYPQG